jgi:hypothetical protein
MARLGNEFLDQHLVVAERGAGFALGASYGFAKLIARGDDTHAAATAACRRLDQDRIADDIGRGLERGELLVGAVIAGHYRYAGGFHQCLGRRFGAHQANGLDRRTNEHQTGVTTRLGEVGVLREKAVAGMDSLSAGRAGGVDDRLDVQVAVPGGRRADQHGLVGERDVERVAVGVGEHRDRPHAHALCRADDPAGNLATVGDQELVEAADQEHRHILKMPKRVGSGGGALSEAASASASTVRVSAGSMMPSSQSRALA